MFPDQKQAVDSSRHTQAWHLPTTATVRSFAYVDDLPTCLFGASVLDVNFAALMCAYSQSYLSSLETGVIPFN